VKTLIPLFGFVVLCCACDKNSTDDLTEPTPVDMVTYTEHVKPIIDNNCIVCHANPPVNSAPMPLIGYEHVKQAVIERGLIDRISREQGAPGMMPNGGMRLPQHQIDLIIQWKDQGFQE